MENGPGARHPERNHTPYGGYLRSLTASQRSLLGISTFHPPTQLVSVFQRHFIRRTPTQIDARRRGSSERRPDVVNVNYVTRLQLREIPDNMRKCLPRGVPPWTGMRKLIFIAILRHISFNSLISALFFSYGTQC